MELETLDSNPLYAYFWIKHIRTGEVTVGRFERSESSIPPAKFEIMGSDCHQWISDYEIITQLVQPLYYQK